LASRLHDSYVREGGIAWRHFPFAQVVAAIDGTNTLRAHGDSDMPVWGELFRAQANTAVAEPATVRGTVMPITEYLGS